VTAERDTAAVRELNDRLRRLGLGGAVFITRGVESLGPEAILEVRAAVAGFDTFSEDNDPWGEHDCAVLTFGPHRVIFKIDYYDPTLTAGSEDPADATVTRRVLTIMLAEEY
jgi:hypothetical protein